MLAFTADTHLLEARASPSIAPLSAFVPAQDEALVTNWNATIAAVDTV